MELLAIAATERQGVANTNCMNLHTGMARVVNGSVSAMRGTGGGLGDGIYGRIWPKCGGGQAKALCLDRAGLRLRDIGYQCYDYEYHYYCCIFTFIHNALGSALLSSKLKNLECAASGEEVPGEPNTLCCSIYRRTY